MTWGSDIVLAKSVRTVVHSEHVGDDLEVSVALPAGSGAARAVLVVLDPSGLFLTAVETSRTLSRLAGDEYRIAVVGVGTTLDADYGHRRFRDFTPVTDDGFRTGPDGAPALGTGGADRLLAALDDEVLPEVAREVPAVDGAPLAIAGWSLSGLFALWAWNTRPDLFDRAIAVSPSLWWGDHSLLSSPIASGTGRRVYACVGSHEEGDQHDWWPAPPADPDAHERAQMITNLRTWTAAARTAGVDVTSEILPNVHHASSGQIGISRGVRVVFDDRQGD